MRNLKIFSICVACATLLVSCGSSAPRTERTITSEASGDSRVQLEMPAEAVRQGGMYIVSVQAPSEIKDTSGMFQGHAIEFFPDGDTSPSSGGIRRYSALVGVKYDTTPGPVELAVTVKLAGETIEKKGTVAVKATEFPSEKLRVPPKTVTPSKRDMVRIKRDNVVLARAYATKTLNRYWDPPVVLPTDTAVTSVFGTSRVYNNIKTNAHLGTDLRAPTGTPILAPMTGQVAVARNLFYTGFTVILDHGYGLFTIYGHMSKLKVTEGTVIKKGQVMGLSGATGRASGPHLHWGVNLHGTKIDPMVLVETFKKNQG